MASSDEDDLFAAALEYLNARHADLEREVAQLKQQTGIHVTLDAAADIVEAVVASIHKLGNSVLADRYWVAYQRMRQAEGLCREFIDRHLEVDRRDEMRRRDDAPEESAEWVAAHDAYDDASEEFERVEADVSAYLRGLDEKGGA